MRTGSALGSVVVWLALCGCVAAFPGERLPRQSFEALTPSRVDAVDYELTLRRDNLADPSMLAVLPERLALHLEHVFEKADVGLGYAPLHLAVLFSGHTAGLPDGGGEEAATFFTLGAVPSASRHWFSLVVYASWNGEPLRSFAYTDEIVIWSGWQYLSHSMASSNAYRPHTVASDMVDNMLVTFLLDLERDLEARTLGGAGSN